MAVLLHFTGSGRTLIADSVAGLDELYGEFVALVGLEPFEQLCRMLREVYRAFHLEEDVFASPAILGDTIYIEAVITQDGLPLMP